MRPRSKSHRAGGAAGQAERRPSWRPAIEDQAAATAALQALDKGRYHDPGYRQLEAEEYALDLRLHLTNRPAAEWQVDQANAVTALRLLAPAGLTTDQPADLIVEAHHWLWSQEAGSSRAAHLASLYLAAWANRNRSTEL
jgi:hypothetical protein